MFNNGDDDGDDWAETLLKVLIIIFFECVSDNDNDGDDLAQALSKLLIIIF